MRRWQLVLILAAAVLGLSTMAFAQNAEQEKALQQLRALQWQRGPAAGHVGTLATVAIPNQYVFLNEPETSKFLQLMGNPPKSGYYAFAPESLTWFAVFHFNDTGYVKDDEKIDPNALLESLKASDGPANEERRKLGMSQLVTEGWLVPPHYDVATKRLEWGVRLRGDSGEQTINYTTRLLGRTGVMAATLVSSPERIGADMEVFRKDLARFAFVPGQTYAEYRSGDKVAEYGLGALVLGGAAAAAAKTGLLKTLGKFIWLGVLAVLAASGGIWKKISGRKE
jgi:uncharacterized membrane-anchored protein